MVRCNFELATGQWMEYELFLPRAFDPKVPIPFLVSVSGAAQRHVNGFSLRLPSESWALAVPLRPEGAPLLFEGRGAPGDGVWHLRELCRHLKEEYNVDGGRFLMLGVSNGGSAVLRFATLWPRLCCGLVVVTGCLQGLVELPADLRKLQGIPVDMYVGTLDECGFYEPMKALQGHFRAIGHDPEAQLTVFKDAGHCCSPLIDDFLLHGKIFLMLLRAGVAGAQLNLNVPTGTRLPAGELLSSLGGFSEVLGLQWVGKGDNGLEVIAAGAVRSQIAVPEAPSVPELGAMCAADFALGDLLEVWSNSQQRWVMAIVEKIWSAAQEAIAVSFESEQGKKLSKTVPIAYAHDYLRRPCICGPPSPLNDSESPSRRRALGNASKPCMEKEISMDTFVRGDRVAVWSDSRQMWFQDGEVLSVTADAVAVNYSNGALSKVLPIEQAMLVLSKHAESQALLPPRAVVARAVANMETPCADVEEAAPHKRAAGRHVTLPKKPQPAPPAARLPQTLRADLGPGWQPDGGSHVAPSPSHVGQASPNGGSYVAPAAASPFFAGQTKASPNGGSYVAPAAASPFFAGQTKAAAASPAGRSPLAASPSGGRLRGALEARSPTAALSPAAASPSDAKRLAAGSAVAVWSASQKKWFQDGLVAEIAEGGSALFVRFGEGAMGKWIEAAHVPNVIKLLQRGPLDIMCY